ncbi:Protein O-GlcNAc transferase, partial [Bertholletia excelsa]
DGADAHHCPANASCAATHDSPALVFSAGGWRGNVFHDFNENFIPLFITVDTFFPDRDFILGIYNCSDWWLHHYRNLLSSYTIHPIINLDKETTLHCFSSAIVGLVSHGPTIVDPTVQRGPHPKTLHDFRAFLIANYVQSHATLLGKIMGDSALSLPWRSRHRPRLLIVNRGGTRRILNIDDVYRVAEEMGFEVVVFEPSPTTSLHEAFRVVHSSHALIGVHGDALTNILFLRPGAVFMQMVPLKCGWLGNICFGKMAIRLGLEYIIYEIRGHESAIELDNVTRDWLATREDPMEQWAIYKRQLITLDLARLKIYLERISDNPLTMATTQGLLKGLQVK